MTWTKPGATAGLSANRGRRIGGHRIGMPLIFGRAEDDPVHGAGEETTLPGNWIDERHFHGMVFVMILIHEHDSPLPIGPLDRIRRDQDVSIFVLYIARDNSSFGGRPYNYFLNGSDMHQLQGTVSWVKGAHELKFGAEARLHRINSANPGPTGGQSNFDL